MNKKFRLISRGLLVLFLIVDSLFVAFVIIVSSNLVPASELSDSKTLLYIMILLGFNIVLFSLVMFSSMKKWIVYKVKNWMSTKYNENIELDNFSNTVIEWMYKFSAHSKDKNNNLVSIIMGFFVVSMIFISKYLNSY